MESYTPPARSRILVAVTSDLRERFERVLQRHELVEVQSASEALQALQGERFKIVLISVHFDESQMFSLLGDIRSHSRYRKIPILCVLGVQRGRAITDVAVEGLDHAVKALRANGFLDLEHFPDDAEGNARIARIVDYLILIDGDLQHIARMLDDSVVQIERRRRQK
ncbi:MAG TPA: hypothetical protein VE034_06170 [Burkholderiales bacterium]|nr:hypothetical protein [Burkholderiales bacterium]